MKLLVFTPYYPPIYSAAGTRIFEFVSRMSKSEKVKEINIVLWNPNFDYSEKEIPELPKTRIMSVRFGKKLPKSIFKHQDPNPFYASVWFALTAKYCKKFKPDLVYFTTPPGTILIGCLWCRTSKIKYIIDYRDLWTERNDVIISKLSGITKHIASFLHAVFKEIALNSNKKAEYIITVHEEIKKRIGQNVSTPILLVPNGLDLEEVNRARKLSESQEIKNYVDNIEIIAYVGHLGVSYLAPDIILPSIQKLVKKYPRIELWIFSMAQDKNFESKIENNNLTNHVRFFCKNHTEMLAILHHAKFGYIPLKSDDPQSSFVYPAKFFDYLSAGLPILVVSDRDSEIYKFVKKCKNGISLTWEEIDSLDDCIKQLIINNVYRIQAKNTIQLAIQLFDIGKAHERLAKEIIKIKKH
jgi:glycosyltransferase involved in cell wall biosynthesis